MHSKDAFYSKLASTPPEQLPVVAQSMTLTYQEQIDFHEAVRTLEVHEICMYVCIYVYVCMYLCIHRDGHT